MSNTTPLINLVPHLVDEVSGFPAYSFILDFLEKNQKLSQIYSFKQYNFKDVVRFIRRTYNPNIVLGLDEADNPLNGASIILSSPDISFMLAKTDVAIYSKNIELISEFERFIIQYNTVENNTELHQYSNGRYVFQTDSSRPAYKEVYPELYPDINIRQLADNFLESKESILILYGDPGVGKSSFVKYIYSLGKLARVFLLQSLELASSPGAINDLPNRDDDSKGLDLLFLDDIDVLLAARDAKSDEKNSLILSTFLSMTDSIKLPPKVILTTNVALTEIDSALIRPGRCFDFIHVKPMSYDYALTILEQFNITLEQFNQRFKPGDLIYQSHFMELVNDLHTIDQPTYYRNPKDDIPVSQKLNELNIKIKVMSDNSPKSEMLFGR